LTYLEDNGKKAPDGQQVNRMPQIQQIQRVLLVLVDLEGQTEQSLEWELAELKELVVTAGGQVTGTVSQRRAKADPALLVGKGKAEEIAQLAEAQEATLVIFNRQLSPAQLRNLEEIIPVQVLDRNQLILDIFVQRAASLEGKLQVELAQLQYLLPRLTGRGVEMSRLGGGIGTRGPGETKLETDRRRIRRKIDILKADLKEVEQRRAHQRKHRQKQGIPLISLVGYTNTGKTSLLSALTDAATPGENKLFATLDPAIRQLELPSGQKALLSDTVGFIRHLPPKLVEAFKATLEEIREADLVLHVVDASHPQLEEQAVTVQQVLKDIDADGVMVILVLNKIDKLREPGQAAEGGQQGGNGPIPSIAEIELLLAAQGFKAETVAVSAVKGTNLTELLAMIEDSLNRGLAQVQAVIPYNQGQLFSYLKEKTVISKVEYVNEGILIELLADEEVLGLIGAFLVTSP
jgi:GTP-binding protein HflX